MKAGFVLRSGLKKTFHILSAMKDLMPSPI